ncbi:MAG: hypothetical protein EBS05_26285 [Proteobacteria bacterium]|nr:hypothetical protein [Pseudomonadota bacterium]
MNLRDYLSRKGKAPKGKPKGWLYFCHLDVSTGTLWAGDPNIADATDGCVVEVPSGKYVVEGIGKTFNAARLVSKLRARLECIENPVVGDAVGDTGTDSAMIGICDIKAFEAACGPDSGEEVQEAIESQTGTGFGIVTIEKFPGAVMPFVPTGSDGSGPVFALISDGKCVGIELSFMEEDDGADTSTLFGHVMESEVAGGDPLTDILLRRVKVFGAETDNLIRKIKDLCCHSELQEWWTQEIGASKDRALVLRKARTKYDELVKRARANGWEIR